MGMPFRQVAAASILSAVALSGCSTQVARRLTAVNLGYFASEEEAEAARRLAAAVFPRATVVRFVREAPPPEEFGPEKRLHEAQDLPAVQRTAYF